MDDAKLLCRVLSSITGKFNSLKIAELIALLNSKNDPEDFFCDRFELGSWFYESLQANDIKVIPILESMVAERLNEEADDEQERTERQQELEGRTL